MAHPDEWKRERARLARLISRECFIHDGICKLDCYILGAVSEWLVDDSKTLREYLDRNVGAWAQNNFGEYARHEARQEVPAEDSPADKVCTEVEAVPEDPEQWS